MNQEQSSPFSPDAEDHEDSSLDSFSLRESENQVRADFLLVSHGGANRSSKGLEPNEDNPIVSIDSSDIPDYVVPYTSEGQSGTYDDDADFLRMDSEISKAQAEDELKKLLEKYPELEESDFEAPQKE
jgi:hypothetical protein